MLVSLLLRLVLYQAKEVANQETFRLGQHAYVNFASIVGFENYANTTTNLLGGLFNFAAALYYTNQIRRVSRLSRIDSVLMNSCRTTSYGY
jgi:hypothetical protein